MQLCFGTFATSTPGREVFHQLAALSQQSTPGLAPSIITDETLHLGVVSRAFSAWRAADAPLKLFLDGEILFINNSPTVSQGRSQAELAEIARLYRTHQADVWRRLDGNFCLIISDGQTLQIGIDPAGTRSVYWWQHDGLLAFHSHLLDLAPCYPGQLTEHFGALGNFLATGTYPPGTTAFHEIQHLSPGCYLTVADGKVEMREHFRMIFQPVLERTPQHVLIDELTERLATSIQGCWNAAKHPVVPLSGGADSRYIVAELARSTGTPHAIPTITWGEDRARPHSDAVVAAQVAAALGVENQWYEKTQSHLETEWARTLYLSSGEADCAVQYPDDHRLHRELAQQGFAALFRGDECFGRGLTLHMRRALLPANDLSYLRPDDQEYRAVLGAEALAAMARRQAASLATILDGLQSPTPTGQRDELYYGFRLRQVLVVYNRVKHADLEVYNPLLSRQVLDWNRGLPDDQRQDKRIFRATLLRNFPALASIPFAANSNLPSWQAKFRREPQLVRFYHDVCAADGWLDQFGTKATLLTRLRAIEAAASIQAPTSERAAQKPVSKRMRQWLKHTLPGQLLREITLESQFAARVPLYLKLGRLAVLHSMLGQIYRRKAGLPASSELSGHEPLGAKACGQNT